MDIQEVKKKGVEVLAKSNTKREREERHERKRGKKDGQKKNEAKKDLR